ncbi:MULTISPECIES: methyltransferase [unclassified Streptomyces]|uniref:methyltransferase n=1 Tax=unclassified Streptomyces TaxID=2593676 RepID=UPI0033AF2BB9
MPKLSKEDAKKHREACRLVELKRDLTEDEKDMVLDYWQESSNVTNSLDGAFFTPLELAFDLRFHVAGDRIIDLCAGIGTLAYGSRELFTRQWENRPPREIVCVEKNPAYVKVGRKILPEATWIEGDVLDVPGMNLGTFDAAIANPPFGNIARSGNGPGYRGLYFEYHTIAVASQIARHGAFIVPQMSAPFEYSGRPYYRRRESRRYEQFHRQTGIVLGDNIGVDTSYYADAWRGVSPLVEIVTCDFEEHPPKVKASRTPTAERPAQPSAAVVPVPHPAPVETVSSAEAEGFLF